MNRQLPGTFHTSASSRHFAIFCPSAFFRSNYVFLKKKICTITSKAFLTLPARSFKNSAHYPNQATTTTTPPNTPHGHNHSAAVVSTSPLGNTQLFIPSSSPPQAKEVPMTKLTSSLKEVAESKVCTPPLLAA